MGLLTGIVGVSPITSDSFVHRRRGKKRKEAHGRITRASLQMNQIFVYLRDHLLIDPKLSMAYCKIMSQPFQPSRLDPGSKIFLRVFAQANHKLQFSEGAQKAKVTIVLGAISLVR
jgi:hypothetical protein